MASLTQSLILKRTRKHGLKEAIVVFDSLNKRLVRNATELSS